MNNEQKLRDALEVFRKAGGLQHSGTCKTNPCHNPPDQRVCTCGVNDVYAALALPAPQPDARLVEGNVLVTDRHRNRARQLLGKVYRTKTNPPHEYPEIGAVEVKNAVDVLALALASTPASEALSQVVNALTVLIPHDRYCAVYNIPEGHKCDCGRAEDIVDALRSASELAGGAK